MKVLCVGSNYAHHVKEMGGNTPANPIWFWKPPSAIIRNGDAVRLPTSVGEIHHEVELAVRLAGTLKDASPAAALEAVDAFTVAVDVTARDLQKDAKKHGRPWTQAKGYDTFLPLGDWRPARGVDLQDLQLLLTVDGDMRQQGSTADMTWGVAELLTAASTWTTLREGDILLTGTPEGVGPLSAGDAMHAEVVGHVGLDNPVEATTPPLPTP